MGLAIMWTFLKQINELLGTEGQDELMCEKGFVQY